MEKRFYDYRMKAVVTIQRVFRGYRGRKVFFVGKEESRACYGSCFFAFQVATMIFFKNFSLSTSEAIKFFVMIWQLINLILQKSHTCNRTWLIFQLFNICYLILWILWLFLS